MPESICGEDSPPQPSDGVEAEAEADADHARRNVRYNWRQDPVSRRNGRRVDHGFGSDNDSDFESDFRATSRGTFGWIPISIMLLPKTK